MKKIFISIDVEPDLHTNKYSSVKILPKLLKILDEYDCIATFFTTSDCIEKYPEIFKKVKRKGHEIAIHGYKHVRLDTLSNKDKEENIKKSLACFLKYLKIKPKGFRAPQHSIDDETIEILKKNKILYDSSLMPWNFYHIFFFWKIKVKLSHTFSRISPYKQNGISEIPISSFILPFSSVTLRILPKFLLRIYLYFISKFKFPVFMMHSWDLIEIPNSKLYKLCNKNKFLNKLDYLLNYFSKRRKFSPIRDIIFLKE